MAPNGKQISVAKSDVRPASRRRRNDAIQIAENVARVLGADSRSGRAAGDPMRVKPCRKYSLGSSAVENWAIAKSRTRKNLTERIDYQPTFRRGAT